jgi:hypothetical protein
MIRKRKRDLMVRYSLFGILSSLYAILFGEYVVFTWGDPLQTKLVPIVLFALSLPLFFWSLYYVMLRDERRVLKHGIVLTNDSLLVRGIEIPLDRILKVEMADFGTGSHFLAIGYVRESRGKRATLTELMWPSDTEDVWGLCNKIRELGGWPEQRGVQTYGRLLGWGRWKAILKELASD